LTGQDWDVDGATGGSAGTASGTGASQPGRESSESQPANVVPFPGNWFGSVEDLIPVHPDPHSPVFAAPPAEDPPAVSAADASDFWEGDAATLQEVSAPTESTSSIALLRSPGAPKRRSAAPASSEPEGAAGLEGAAGPEGAERESAPPKRHLLSRGVVALACIALVGGVLLLTHAVPGQRGSGLKRQSGHSDAAARQQTTHVVTQTVTARVTATSTVPVRTHRGESAKRSTQKPSSTATSAAWGGATDSHSRTSGLETSSNASSPPATPSHAPTSSGSSGTGCVAQSPDSGCRP
jgi:hypothetical protein